MQRFLSKLLIDIVSGRTTRVRQPPGLPGERSSAKASLFHRLPAMFPAITGAHVLLYSDNPEADPAFFRDILGFPAVDAGGGWLIFALPPAEVGIHPSDGERRPLHGGRQLLGSVLYLMCDDLSALVKSLQAKG
jgi:hypothetical protein